jgi:hypothetical protein
MRDPASGSTWEEQLWDNCRPVVWFVLPVLALFDLYAFGRLSRAATDGMAYVGRPGRRQWVPYEVDPIGFWWSVFMAAAALVCCLGLPLWLAYRVPKLRAARKRAEQGRVGPDDVAGG